MRVEAAAALLPQHLAFKRVSMRSRRPYMPSAVSLFAMALATVGAALPLAGKNIYIPCKRLDPDVLLQLGMCSETQPLRGAERIS